jgi:hypothetical protein
MNTDLVDIDSQIWGRSVLQITSFSPSDNFKACEDSYIRKYAPAYVSASVSVDDVDRIGVLCNAGFIPVDCQLTLRVAFQKTFDTAQYGMKYLRVNSEARLKQVLDIAAELSFSDRFSRDPLVPHSFSARRYEAYLRQSFTLSTDEIWALADAATSSILAFRSHRKTSSTQAQLLLGGVRKDLIGEGLGAISTYFCFNQMATDGIKRAITRISVSNKPVFDLEATHFGFRYQQVNYIFRKHYPASKQTNSDIPS